MNAHEKLKRYSSGAIVSIDIPVDKLTSEFERVKLENEELKAKAKSLIQRQKAEKIIRERTIIELLETLEGLSLDELPLNEEKRAKKAMKSARHNLGLIEYTRK